MSQNIAGYFLLHRMLLQLCGLTLAPFSFVMTICGCSANYLRVPGWAFSLQISIALLGPHFLIFLGVSRFRGTHPRMCSSWQAIQEFVRGHSSLLLFPFRQLPLASTPLPPDTRLHLPFCGFLNWTHCGRASTPFPTCGSSSALRSFHFYFIFHYGVIPSCHLPSYFPSYHFHFIYLFHCPIVVYISTLSDRKVPILFFLDFLSGKSPFV